MFFVTYLRRELGRRTRQAIFIALGLALGVGLVVTVAAASAGVRKAQSTVLSALYGVGTDVTVTGATVSPPKPGAAPPQGSSPPAVYVPLARAQAMSPQLGGSLKNDVNTIYLAAASAADIPVVQKEISGLLPGTTVTANGRPAGSRASSRTSPAQPTQYGDVRN